MAEPTGKDQRPGGQIPYELIAAVFVPAVAAYIWFLQSVESFRFAHPAALALIPLAVALVVWAGIRQAPGRRAALMHSRASELGKRKRGIVAKLRELPMGLRLLAGGPPGGGPGPPPAGPGGRASAGAGLGTGGTPG